MRYCLAIISIFLSLFATHTQSISRSDRNGCFYRSDLATKLLGGPDRRIAACTRIIRGLSDRFARSSAYFTRALAYRLKGDIDHAVADYSMATEPGCGFMGYNRPATRDDVKVAIAISESIHNPKDAFTFIRRGDAYYQRGDLDRAIADYSEAIRLDPKNPSTFGRRGDAYGEKADPEHAIADYSEAIQLKPPEGGVTSAYSRAVDASVAYYYCRRGMLIQKQGDIDHAIADYTEAIRLNPQSEHPFKNRGDAYREKGDVDHAINDYIDAYHRTTNLPDFTLLGDALVALFAIGVLSIIIVAIRLAQGFTRGALASAFVDIIVGAAGGVIAVLLYSHSPIFPMVLFPFVGSEAELIGAFIFGASILILFARRPLRRKSRVR